MQQADVFIFIVLWVAGCAMTGQLISAWFDSSLPRLLLGCTRPEAMTSKELMDSWLLSPPLGIPSIGLLLNCPTCLGTWIAVAVSILPAALLLPTGAAVVFILLSPGWAFTANRLRR